MSPSVRRVSIFLALACLVVSAGCTGLLGTGDEDPAADLAERVEAADAPTAMAAIQETTVVSSDGTTTSTDRVWLHEDGKSRTEAVDGSYVIVDDGETARHLDTGTNVVTSLDVQSTEESQIERLHAEGKRHLENLDAVSVEETTVDGRAGHRVTFDPPADDPGRSIDLLVGDTTYRISLEDGPDPPEHSDVERIEVVYDDETSFPLAYRLDAGEESFEITYEDVTFDGAIDDDRFEFEPPEEASVEALVLPAFESFDTVADADANVSFPVAEPAAETLPDGVDLREITRAEYPDENRTQVELSYRTGDDAGVLVATGDAPRGYVTDGEAVAVGDASGRLEHTDRGTKLEWACDGLHYSIFADETFPAETALAVGESIGCGSS